MADNYVANPGVGGDTFAADDVAGVKFARMKLTLGADGVDGGDVASTNPMPVSSAAFSTVASAVYNEDSPVPVNTPGVFVLAQRNDSDVSTADNGDFTALKMDEAGRLKVATQPASYAPITGSIAAVAATVFAECTRFSNLMLHCTGTFAGINCTFEGSLNSTNGTNGNWFAVQAIRSNANTIELTTGVLGAAPAYAWELSVNALKYFRVRCTARVSGTQAWTFIPGTYATEPIPGAQVSGTQPVSGSVTVSGTVTATVGTSITGGAIAPLTLAGVTVDASAARGTSANGTTTTNASGRGAMFYVNVSAASGTLPTLVVQLQVQDPVSLAFIDITGAATVSLTGIGLVMLTVYPGISEVANLKISQGLPRTYRFRWTIGGTTPSFTFSIGAQYLL